MPRCSESAVSFSPFKQALTPISMLDCPEQSQTSPTMTSSSLRVFDPLTVSVKGPPAFIGGNTALHSPAGLATVFC